MPWASRQQNRPLKQLSDSTTGFADGDIVTLADGRQGEPIGLALALTRTPIYSAGVKTPYGFKGLKNV